jgi:mannitol/fructose-specific phosphotransferase system IIA component (Ntr-type)
MKMSDLVLPETVIAELSATNRNAAIQEMVRALTTALGLDERETASITGAVIDREEQGTTAIGRGAAIPHITHGSISTASATIALSAGGIDFAARDGNKVHFIVLLLSPVHNADGHVRAMSTIFRFLQDKQARRLLGRAKTREEINAVVAGAKQSVP